MEAMYGVMLSTSRSDLIVIMSLPVGDLMFAFAIETIAYTCVLQEMTEKHGCMIWNQIPGKQRIYQSRIRKLYKKQSPVSRN